MNHIEDRSEYELIFYMYGSEDDSGSNLGKLDGIDVTKWCLVNQIRPIANAYGVPGTKRVSAKQTVDGNGSLCVWKTVAGLPRIHGKREKIQTKFV